MIPWKYDLKFYMLNKKHIFLQDKEKKKLIAVKAVVRDT